MTWAFEWDEEGGEWGCGGREVQPCAVFATRFTGGGSESAGVPAGRAGGARSLLE